MTETAIAPRALSLPELERRIDLNKRSGWGLEGGSQDQLNLLALYCQRFGLLPGEEVTLYQGKPYITVDGRVTLMRRHPNYQRHVLRPLSKDEKLAWGYEVDDWVVECRVYLKDGTYQDAWGRVSRNETRNAVAKTHPVEMAQKRALTRGERFTFGTEAFVDDQDLQDAVQTVIEERTDPKRVAHNAREYDRVFGMPEQEPARRSKAAMREEWNRLKPKAQELGVELPRVPGADATQDEAEAVLAELKNRIRAKEEELLDLAEGKGEQSTMEIIDDD